MTKMDEYFAIEQKPKEAKSLSFHINHIRSHVLGAKIPVGSIVHGVSPEAFAVVNDMLA